MPVSSLSAPPKLGSAAPQYTPDTTGCPDTNAIPASGSNNNNMPQCSNAARYNGKNASGCAHNRMLEAATTVGQIGRYPLHSGAPNIAPHDVS